MDRPAQRGGKPRPPRIDLPQPHHERELLYGRNAVLEALRGRRLVMRLLLAEGIHEDERIRQIISAAERRGLPIVRVPRAELDRLTRQANHQGVVLEAGPYPYVAFDALTRMPGTLLILDHLQDPQNFGSLLRTAEATGVHGVIVPEDRAVGVTPAVVNASAGAVEHLAIARVTNLPRTIEALKRAGWWIIALDTGPDAQDLFRSDLPAPVALVVGAEGTGISRLVRKLSDLVVQIPMTGKVASLNAAAAGSIALYELFRRQHQGS
ncbi:MAG: 23S rRNA (guanosine(2251)-2'-O)-methyltransferase RlmB [Thermomicrobiales bacterium]|nr:MAG: 23S rRNA (guanosine(2251)-2'-O)-methyltransferase RlmB [Thermomicrobiales bacterium]